MGLNSIEDSLQLVRNILDSNPDHLLALQFMSANPTYNTLEKLKSLIRLSELDLACEYEWYYRIEMIADYVAGMYGHNVTSHLYLEKVSLEERLSVTRAAWEILDLLFKHGYESTEGRTKLIFAILMVDHPVVKYLNILNVDTSFLTTDFVEYYSRLKADIVNDIIMQGKAQNAIQMELVNEIDMFCNDYSFELGLLNHCFETLETYSGQVTVFGQLMKESIEHALITTALAITRDCTIPASIQPVDYFPN